MWNFDYECGQCGELVKSPGTHDWQCPKCGGQIYGLGPAVHTHQISSNIYEYNIDRESPQEIAVKQLKSKEKHKSPWAKPEVEQWFKNEYIPNLPKDRPAAKGWKD